MPILYDIENISTISPDYFNIKMLKTKIILKISAGMCSILNVLGNTQMTVNLTLKYKNVIII